MCSWNTKNTYLGEKSPSGPCNLGGAMCCLLDQGKAVQKTLSTNYLGGKGRDRGTQEAGKCPLHKLSEEACAAAAQAPSASSPENTSQWCFKLPAAHRSVTFSTLGQQWDNAGASSGEEIAEKGSGCCFFSLSRSLNPLWHSHSPEMWWWPAGYNSWWFSLNNLSTGQP